MGPPQGRAEEEENLPRPAAHTPRDAPQDPIGLLGTQGTLLAHGQPVVPQHSQSLSLSGAWRGHAWPWAAPRHGTGHRGRSSSAGFRSCGFLKGRSLLARGACLTPINSQLWTLSISGCRRSACWMCSLVPRPRARWRAGWQTRPRDARGFGCGTALALPREGGGKAGWPQRSGDEHTTPGTGTHREQGDSGAPAPRPRPGRSVPWQRAGEGASAAPRSAHPSPGAAFAEPLGPLPVLRPLNPPSRWPRAPSEPPWDRRTRPGRSPGRGERSGGGCCRASAQGTHLPGDTSRRCPSWAPAEASPPASPREPARLGELPAPRACGSPGAGLVLPQGSTGPIKDYQLNKTRSEWCHYALLDWNCVSKVVFSGRFISSAGCRQPAQRREWASRSEATAPSCSQHSAFISFLRESEQ